jgi:RNA polymerase sigma factor (TIGR02999 family)
MEKKKKKKTDAAKGRGPSESQATFATSLLLRMQDGDQEAAKELIDLVYEKLRGMARNRMRDERTNHTLQPTALVHEVYIQLAEQGRPLSSRKHFYFAAARAMWQLLASYARERNAEKRGGRLERLPLEAEVLVGPDESLLWIEVLELLDRLEAEDERKAQIVKLRLLVGQTNDEVADLLGVSVKTVEREWRLIRSWFTVELRRTRRQVAIREAMPKLSTEERQAIDLHRTHGTAWDTIAEEMGLASPGEAKTLHAKALIRIKQIAESASSRPHQQGDGASQQAHE